MDKHILHRIHRSTALRRTSVLLTQAITHAAQAGPLGDDVLNQLLVAKIDLARTLHALPENSSRVAR